MRSKYGIEYRGMWFAKDHKTGYYLNSRNRKRLHRYVWECERGPIPKGYDIHHIDGNKDNNEIVNLQLLSRVEHHKLHGVLLTDEEREWLRRNMDEKARPAAIAWHKSDEGSKWHKIHCNKVKEKFHHGVSGICQRCGEKFMGIYHQRFCSKQCKSSWLKEHGLPHVEAKCEICGRTVWVDEVIAGHSYACKGSCMKQLKLKKEK